MNIIKRFTGMFSNPGPVFQSLGEKPIWSDALIVILLAVIVFSVFVTPYSRHDQLGIYENSAKMKQALGEARYNQTIESLKKPLEPGAFISAGGMAVVMTVIAILVQCLFLMIISRFASIKGTFIQVLAIYLHANFIDKVLGNAVRMVLVMLRKSVMQTSTGLALLFPKIDVFSPAYVVMSQIDFFQIWTFGLIGLGLSKVLNIELKKAMILAYGFWLLKCLVNIPIGLMTLSFMR